MDSSLVYYTTVTDIQEQLMKETPASVPDPTTVEYTNFVGYLQNQLIPDVSDYINEYTHRFFVPKYMTDSMYNRNLFNLDSLEDHGYWLDWNKYRLYLSFDLLEVVTYTSTATAITSTEYRIVGVPGYAFDLDYDSNDLDFDTDAFNNSQDILGWYGYHEDWANAFATVETVTVTDSATSITVATDARNNYKLLQYVRCEDELMLITAVAATTLTVQRGVRGTTAAAHSGKALQTYSIDGGVHIAATRMCSWLYNNRVSQGNVIQISDNAVVLDQLPTMIKDNLNRLIKRAAV